MKKKYPVPNYVFHRLENVQHKLEDMTTQGTACTLDAEIKRAVKIYVDSWILPDVEMLVHYAKGGKIPDWWKK